MSGTDRYATMFAQLRTRGEAALVPFLVLGDPDPETSLELLRALVRGGADAVELGVPFSDPIADGPVIQAAAQRALAAGTRLRDAWRILAAFRSDHPHLPIGLLVYANLALQEGGRPFCAGAAGAGVDSVLVADLPIAEAAPFHATLRAHGLAPVSIAPPNADPERLERIAAGSDAYVYVTSRPGVTGADETLRHESAEVIARLRALGTAPPLLGFGIAGPDQVRSALALGAAGAIAGSVVVRQVAEHLGDRDRMCIAVEQLVASLKQATRPC
jgi:tryptophan synthase alpha chain